MKKLTLLITFLMAVSLLSGCQATSTTETKETKTNETANKPADNSSKPAASPAEKEEKPTSSLKPEDIDLEKPFSATELNTAFLADEDAWKGKEVAITGKYHSTTESTVADGKRIRVDIADQATNKKVAGCVVKEKVPEEVSKKREDRVFKGTIKENSYGRILIEPCEFVK
jgi:hypothetical protein